MDRFLIVGSGPSAAGAALALAQTTDCEITVIDVGLTLEAPNRAAVQRLAAVSPQQWQPEDLRLVTVRPVASASVGPPEKRAYGSDFPFRDVGQRSGVVGGAGVHDQLISGAYGGFSNVWGGLVLPFPNDAFAGWPTTAQEMARHYGTVLSAIPFAAATDDLASQLPLHANFAPIPPLSHRARRIFEAYERHRTWLNRAGLVMGQARMALRAADCVRCGLCMTGCPYSLIYSASQTFDELTRAGRITYHPNLLAIGLEEKQGRPVVTATNLRTSQHHRFEADRVYVACGAIGTTRLVLSSLKKYGEVVELQESMQFVVPFVSLRPTPDPRRESMHTLGQLCTILNLPRLTAEPAHLQLYTYNSAFGDALPFWTRPFAGAAFRRLTVGLGYLPASVSPRLRVRLTKEAIDGHLPGMSVSSDTSVRHDQLVLREVGRLLRRAAPRLDLWPVIRQIVPSAPGKSYHWGGSFPHANRSGLTTDGLGRLRAWKRIHLVDASVLPSIAATTFTLTAMANAHRIAEESLGLDRN